MYIKIWFRVRVRVRVMRTIPTRFELAFPWGSKLAVCRLRPLGHGISYYDLKGMSLSCFFIIYNM